MTCTAILSDGTRTPTSAPLLALYNAALRGVRGHVTDAAGRIIATTDDVPGLRFDGEALPYFNRTTEGA